MTETPKLQRRLNVELTTEGALAVERCVLRSEFSKVFVADRAVKFLDAVEEAIQQGAQIVFRYPDGQADEVIKLL